MFYILLIVLPTLHSNGRKDKDSVYFLCVTCIYYMYKQIHIFFSDYHEHGSDSYPTTTSPGMLTIISYYYYYSVGWADYKTIAGS